MAAAHTDMQSNLPYAQAVLDALAGAAWDFLVITAVFALFTAVLLEATQDFGLRRHLHARLLNGWASQGLSALRRIGLTRAMLALPADELSGHLAALIRPLVPSEHGFPPESLREATPEWMWKAIPADGRTDPLGAAIDRALDQLQLRLRGTDKVLGLMLASYVSLMLAWLLLAGLALTMNTVPILVTIAVSAGLVAPLLRDGLRRAMRLF